MQFETLYSTKSNLDFFQSLIDKYPLMKMFVFKQGDLVCVLAMIAHSHT